VLAFGYEASIDIMGFELLLEMRTRLNDAILVEAASGEEQPGRAVGRALQGGLAACSRQAAVAYRLRHFRPWHHIHASAENRGDRILPV
jgi:hypothetical protein